MVDADRDALGVRVLHSAGGNQEDHPVHERGEDTGTHSIRVFQGHDLPADRHALDAVARQIADADLVGPAVVLPDFHHKSKMEMPSSVAVATEASIRPTLTSSSLNCGMALLALDIDRPTTAGVDSFFREVRERFPYPPPRRPQIARADVIRSAVEGAEFSADAFGVDASELERIEEGGRVDIDRYGGAERLRRQMPWLVSQLSRLRFGTIGPSNHFVELQVVEEVIDQTAASLLGVREGQVTLQYHAGGGALTGEIGRLFGRRKDYPPKLRAQMAVTKPLFHLATARSVEELRLRWALYFAGGCPPVPRHHPEGQRLMLANAAAMNYGFAFRVATYAGLQQLLQRSLGVRATKLVVDSPHNSIYEETVNGTSAVVHRHNSCRAWSADMMPEHPVFSQTGQPVLLPGTNRTSSYLCVAGPGSSRTLHSACHGAGTVIEEFERRGLSRTDPRGRTTLRYRYSDAAPAVAPHLDDHGVNHALGILVRHGVVTPVARMRPFAVLN